MRHSDTYSPIEIKQWSVDEEYAPGKWAPARPCPYEFSFGQLLRSFRIAWHVLVGRYDALNWNADRM
jgi:hypothetical protein